MNLDTNTHFNNNNKYNENDNNASFQKDIYRLHQFNYLKCTLKKLSSHYKIISKDLVIQLSNITNCKTVSLSSFLESTSQPPTSTSILDNIIQSLRDSIIIHYKGDNNEIFENVKSINSQGRMILSYLDTYMHLNGYVQNNEDFNRYKKEISNYKQLNIDDILLRQMNNTLAFTNTSLFKQLFRGLSGPKLSYIITNTDIFIPEVVIYLSNQLWIRAVLMEELAPANISTDDLIASIDKSIEFTGQMLNGIKSNSLKCIYFQICGRILSKDAIFSLNNIEKDKPKDKGLNWSTIFIPRSKIMYRSSFNRISLPQSNLFKFKSSPSKAQSRMLLNNILFNNDLLHDKRDKNAIKKIKNDLDMLEGNTKSKKLLSRSNIEEEFHKFLANLHNMDLKEQLNKYCPNKIHRINPLVDISEIPALKYSIDVEKVVSFIRSLMSDLIPDDLLGSEHNKNTFLNTCRTLVILNKNESLNIDRLIRNFRARNCKWIDKTAKNSYNRCLVIRNYLSRLIYILHKHIACPLLATCFYITECGNSINRLYYFRKADWYKLERLADTHLCASNYVLSNKLLEYNKIRWIPKTKGFRPIWNFSRLPASSEFSDLFLSKECSCDKSPSNLYRCFKCYILMYLKKMDSKMKSKISRNTFLYLIRVVLSHMCRHKSKLMKSSVMSYTHVYKRLCKWWAGFCSNAGKSMNKNKLYIIVADLSMCYESIVHKKLIKTISDLPIPKNILYTGGYCRAFTKISISGRNLGCYGRRIDLIDTSSTEGRDGWLKRFRRQSILKSLVGGGICLASGFDQSQILITKTDINELIKTLVDTLTLTINPEGIGKIVMKQTCGIPQGCCISSFLCSLYMADKDKFISDNHSSTLVPVGNNKRRALPNLMLRWIDDFIFISANKDDAVSVSKILLDAKVYDAKLNLNKLNGNFEPFDKSELEWIGMKFCFDIQNKRINIEMNPWKNPSTVVRDSISFKISPGDFMQTLLVDHLYGYLFNRLSHGLFCSSRLNSKRYIVQNAYVIMRVCMLKLICGLKSLVCEFGGFLNYKFVIDIVFNLVDDAILLVSRFCKLHKRFKLYLKAHLLYALIMTAKMHSREENNRFNRMLGKLIILYRKRIKDSNLPKILVRLILYGINNSINKIESKFDNKWPIGI